MKTGKPPEIENHLAHLRERSGLSAAQLAQAAGVTRQTIYAMEAGSYVPNTAVALRLARELGVGVEDLFKLADEDFAPELPAVDALLLSGGEVPEPGQPVELCRVDRHLVAAAPSPVPWYFPASDAIVSGAAAGGKTRVHVIHAPEESRNRILVAGCDPGISVLARHARAAGVELVLAHRNSTQALELLKQGVIHIAGTHLRDETSGESNIPQIGSLFPANEVAVITFANWEEGILTARGNPKSVRSIEDLTWPDISIVNREPGAGSRRLLDASLERLGIENGNVRGYDTVASGHLAAAWQVRMGAADCAIATRAAARLFGLGFIPLAAERYDLVLRRAHLDVPAIQTLLETLSRSGFRRDLEAMGGYDTKPAGRRVM
jgi:molybdate-binding protein/DNA-binding XRE family transcriptional regulator